MYNGIPGYYNAYKQMVEPDKYYVLSLKNLRKPVLLRFSCKTRLLAKQYIFTYSHPEIYEIIKGEQALERNIPLSRKTVGKKPPCKYQYPPNINTWSKRKQFRTGYRDRLRKAFKDMNNLKQFTIKYRGITYCTYALTFEKAYSVMKKATKMKWEHFIKKLNITPQIILPKTIYIKPQNITLIAINQFNKINHVHQYDHSPTRGKISRLSRGSVSLQKHKPKSLLL